MKQKLKVVVMLFFVLASQFTFAQGKKITGTISDSDGLGLPGASVLIKGTNIGAQTDFDEERAFLTGLPRKFRRFWARTPNTFMPTWQYPA